MMEAFSQTELKEAKRAIDSTCQKCEKVLPKLKPGTAQHTLLTRRIDAFRIAGKLIAREMEKDGLKANPD